MRVGHTAAVRLLLPEGPRAGVLVDTPPGLEALGPFNQSGPLFSSCPELLGLSSQCEGPLSVSCGLNSSGHWVKAALGPFLLSLISTWETSDGPL